MVDSADMKAKEAEKRTDVATLKVLLIESKASQKRSQEIMKREVQSKKRKSRKWKRNLNFSIDSTNQLLDLLFL